MRGFVDAGGRVGPEDAINRYYNNGRAELLNLPLKLVISHNIWGSADTNK
jgi:hypothetical protein